jgi:serine/threonine protein kinase
VKRVPGFASSDHGRFSPRSVVIGVDGRARLIHLFSGSAAQEASDRYTAPELADGVPPTCRADLYAVGIMMLESLTRDGAPLSADVAPFLEVARRASSVAPALRYDSEGAMISALAGSLRDQAPSPKRKAPGGFLLFLCVDQLEAGFLEIVREFVFVGGSACTLMKSV